MDRLITDVDEGKVETTPELDAEVDRDAKLAEQLFEKVRADVLLPFLARHRKAGPEVVASALLRLAALHVMAGLDMDPENFGALARHVAELEKGTATAIREDVERGTPRAKAAAIAADLIAAEEERPETLVEKQVRLVLERQCRELADKLKQWTPAGVGFALFLADFGEKGNTAYVSTVDRADMVRLVKEWLARQ